MVADIIADILKQGERIIVPGLGTFMIDKSKEDCKYFFNEHISYDDGNLSDLVAEKEDISFAEAEAQIKRFVFKTVDKLDEGQSIEIPGIGYLTRDRRKIVLKCPGEADVSSGEANAGVISDKTEKDPEAQEPPKKEEKAMPEETVTGDIHNESENSREENFLAQNDEPKQVKEEHSETENPDTGEFGKSDEETENVEPEKSGVESNLDDPQNKDEDSETSAQEKRRLELLKIREQRAKERENARKEMLEKRARKIKRNGPEYKRRKRRTLIWFFAALFLIMAAAIYALVFKDDFIKDRSQLSGNGLIEQGDAQAENNQEIISGDEPSENLADVSDEELDTAEEINESGSEVAGQRPEEITATGAQKPNAESRTDYLTPPAQKPNKFQVIGGSFKSRANAISFAEEMHEKGYSVQYLGYVNRFHSVSLGAFETRSAARDFQQKLMFQENIDTWVFNY